MEIRRHQVTFDRLDDATWSAWRQLATAVIGDSMGRAGCMCAAIKSLSPGVKLVGHARTVTTMVGDNSTIHAALEFLQSGDVLVIDAGGSCEVAIWGAVITEAAVMRGVAGVVIDGAARDVDELRRRGFPVFLRGVTPRGPHKGHGGVIDGPVAAGGVAVSPGDVIVGDDDGVVVVPLAVQGNILAKARDRLDTERRWLDSIRAGKTTREIVGIPPASLV